MAPGLLSLTLPKWLVLTTEPTNQKIAKKVNQGSSLVYHIWLFSMTLLMNYQFSFEFIYFEFLLYKVNGQPIHYVTRDLEILVVTWSLMKTTC